MRHLQQNIKKIAWIKEHCIIPISTPFQTQMVQIGTISKHAYHVKFQFHKLALFPKHINPSFRLPTLKCTQKKKTHNFSFLSQGKRRRRNPSWTQGFFYMAIFSSSTVVVLALPLLYTFFLYISDLLQDHTPCTKTKLDINSWRMIVCLF